MPIKIDRVLSEILAGKSKVIYFSEACLWWTHLDSDAREATQRGIDYQKAIASFNGSALFKIPKGFTDPLGNAVKKFPDAAAWMRSSMGNPLSYGKHGLRAFMFTHHQNCSDYFSNKWENYNRKLDKLK